MEMMDVRRRWLRWYWKVTTKHFEYYGWERTFKRASAQAKYYMNWEKDK